MILPLEKWAYDFQVLHLFHIQDNVSKIFSCILNFFNFCLDIPLDLPYWVLDTDYHSYTVVWTCVSLGLANMEYIWLMTRERIPSIDVIDAALAVVNSNNLGNISLKEIDQSNC